MGARLSKARAILFGCSALFAVEFYLAQARWSRLETLLGAEKLALQIDRDGVAIRALSVDSRKSSAAAGIAKDSEKVVRQSIFVGHVFSAAESEAWQREQAVASSPEKLRVKMLDAMASLKARYGGLTARLGLSISDRQRLIELLLNKENLPADLDQSMPKIYAEIAASGDVKPGTVSTLYYEAKATVTTGIEADLKQLLGPEKYAQYQEYEANIPRYMLVGHLQRALLDGNALLTTAQADQLVQALSETDAIAYVGRYAMFPMPFGPMGDRKGGYSFADVGPNRIVITPYGAVISTAVISSETIAAASRFLSDQQLKALQQVAAQQSAAYKITGEPPSQDP